MENMKLKGKVAINQGASKGIGKGMLSDMPKKVCISEQSGHLFQLIAIR